MNRPGHQPVGHFHTKIAGVTHPNPDGTDRQALIQQCKVFEPLLLEHQADNPHDPNAVRVCRTNGQQLGYLSSERAAEVASRLKQGFRYTVFVKNITGGGEEGQSSGVNLLVVVAEPGTRDRQVHRYLRHLIRADPELEGAKVRSGCMPRLIVIVLLSASAMALSTL